MQNSNDISRVEEVEHFACTEQAAGVALPSTTVTPSPMSAATINKETSPETAHFLDWLEEEKKKGLVDIKFFKRESDRSTVELFCAEFNQMERAPEIPEHDVL